MKWLKTLRDDLWVEFDRDERTGKVMLTLSCYFGVLTIDWHSYARASEAVLVYEEEG